MKYQDIRRWKYRTINIESIHTDIRLTEPINYPYVKLATDGVLHLHAGYAWNGANVIPDVPRVLRGSLYHDALFQIMRLGALDQTWRKQADDLLRDIWISDGVPPWLAKTMTQFVRWFGGRYSKPDPEREGNLPIKDAP